MGMARGETDGDRGGDIAARGEPVAALASLAAAAFHEHAADLRTHLLRMARDPAVADDLVQECFMRLLTETAAGRTPLHPRAWLFRVATNLVVSGARRQSVAARRAPELLVRDVHPSPEEVLLEREAARSLGEQLAALPPHARTALVLSAHGFSGAEIGRRIGRTELATRSLICRHRRRLRSTTSPAA